MGQQRAGTSALSSLRLGGLIALKKTLEALREQRAQLSSVPSGPVRDAYVLRRKLAAARGRAMHSIHWTPDACSSSELLTLFGSFRVVDVGVPLVRVGGAQDGGYLIPDDLAGLEACFSPGVANVATFEEAMLSRGVPCHMVDGSVPQAPICHPLATFERTFLGPVHKTGWTTLEDWVNVRAPGSGDLILQMDIEGWEWEVLAATPRRTLQRFRILALELHDLHMLGFRAMLRQVQTVFERLGEDFELVNVHPNNYELPIQYREFTLNPVVETTWLRKDRVAGGPEPAPIPHPLELPNDPYLPDVVLGSHWRDGKVG